jgi:predicted peptidase
MSRSTPSSTFDPKEDTHFTSPGVLHRGAHVPWNRAFVTIVLRTLILSTLLPFLLETPVHAETGFLDRIIVVQGTSYKYQVFVPDNWNPRQNWPVILFLHGVGERGNDGLQQTNVGIGSAIRKHRGRVPAIVVMPQCRDNSWWLQSPMGEMAMAALEASSREFRGDPERTYLTGLSMGGYGAWYLSGKYPGQFAALVVICGGVRVPGALLAANPQWAKSLEADGTGAYSGAAARVGKTPVWIFHGAEDDTVPVTESRRMYAAMQAVGAEVHYTEYPGVKHDSWDHAYDEPELFTWLLAKTRSASRLYRAGRPR